MDQLNKNGKVSRGKLGVTIQEMTPELAKSFNVKDVRGVLIAAVDAGSPAEKAGIHVGDIVTQVNGARTDDSNALRNHIAATPPGSDVALTVLRDGHEQTMHAKLVELQTDNEAAATPENGAKESGGGQLGITVEPVTADLVSRLKLKSSQGVVVSEVEPGSPAAEAGIQAGDVVLEVNHEAVKTGADIRAGVKNSGSRPTLLLISRGGQSSFVAVQAK
jgi:serine protease Do